MTWVEGIARYQEYLRSLGRSTRTCHGTRLLLRYFARFCQERGIVRLSEVTSHQVVSYQQELIWRHGARGRLRAATTRNGMMSTVRSFFRWAVRQGHLLMDPAERLVLPQPPRPLHQLLTVEEVQALICAPDPGTPLGIRDKAIIESFYATGIRLRECQQLNLEDVDFNTHTVAVRQAKGGDGHLLPLGRHLAGVLRGYLEESRPHLKPQPGVEAFFLSVRGRRLSCARMTQVVNELARRVLGRSFGAHALRHASPSTCCRVARTCAPYKSF